jgi:hypothetical protein
VGACVRAFFRLHAAGVTAFLYARSHAHTHTHACVRAGASRFLPPTHARSEFITLGVRESEDLRSVVAHLRAGGRVTKIGLWGRSMGAATSLFYGQKDPSVAALVLDSPFSKLTDLMHELVDTFGADRGMHVPRPLVRGAVALLRFTIKRKAKFDIADLDVSAAAAGSFVPALFGHGTGTCASVHRISHAAAWLMRCVAHARSLQATASSCRRTAKRSTPSIRYDGCHVTPTSCVPIAFHRIASHCFAHLPRVCSLFAALLHMQGDKNIIRFEGGHNSQRPPFFYDSVSIFFLNTLHPPETPIITAVARAASASAASAASASAGAASGAPREFVPAEMPPPPLVPVGAPPSAELELLLSMGFPRAVAEGALRRFRSVELASAWLVDVGESGWAEVLREGAAGSAPPPQVAVVTVSAVGAAAEGPKTGEAAGSPGGAHGGGGGGGGGGAGGARGGVAFGDADDAEEAGDAAASETDKALAAALARSLAAAGGRAAPR